MAKILKNTTLVDIELTRVGLTLNSLSQIEISVKDYLQFALPDSLSEIQPFLLSGDIIVNDGLNDLDATSGFNYLSYPDTAGSIRFLSEPERSNGFTAKTVQEAIEEVTGEDNFSYRIINALETIIVPLEQQMIVSNEIRVDGDLRVEGEVYVTNIKQIDPVIELPPDNFSYFNIPSQLTVNIDINQEMYLRDFIKIDGNLVVKGQLSIGGTSIEPIKRIKNKILTNESFVIESDEEYYFRNFLSIDGQVTNNGFITIGV